MNEQQLIESLNQEGYREVRNIEGLGLCGIFSFMYTTAIVVGLNEYGYEYRYCYPKQYTLECLMAFKIWDGKDEPKGRWLKRKGQGGDIYNTNQNEFES